MKARILCICAIASVMTMSVAFGQKNLQEGFIIDNEKDTLYGWINVKSNMVNSESCEFFADPNGEPVIYFPGDIHSYRIKGGKYYITYLITIDGEEKTVFLEFLLKGIANLYYYRALIGEFYFLEKDGFMTELTNEITRIKVEATYYDKPSNQYLRMLRYSFSDAPFLYEQIDNTTFGHKSLIKIATKYHNMTCDTYACVDFTQSTLFRLGFEPSIGVDFQRVGLVTSENSDHNIKTNIAANFSFTSNKNQRWALLTGINYSSSEFSDRFYNDLVKEKTFHDISIQYDLIKIPFIFRYTIPANGFSPYILMGTSSNFLINSKYAVNYALFSVTRTTIEMREEYNVLQKYQQGIDGGIGIRKNISDKLGVNLGLLYEFRTSMKKVGWTLDFLNVQSRMINAGLTYQL
ncbi:MAG: PorT family protein [Cyclobacteriaceae bacterium]|nr:PorT family protein [Cyclobacteriaceae bacterium]